MRPVYATLAALYTLGASCSQLHVPPVDAVVRDGLQAEDAYNHLDHTKSAPSYLSQRQSTSYWYENIQHQGISATGPNGFKVYRNVKDYGAKGDGVTDDTAAINAAMNDGGRCGRGCASSTTTPAVVYFPSGTYLLSSSIYDQYNTFIIGNPNNLPVLKATPSFSGFGLIDGDPYYTQFLNWGSTNVFFRQVKNLIFDTTNVAATEGIRAIHWPTAQATSLQNLVFNLNAASGTQHVGIYCEEGSAGFIADLTFNGGLIGAQIGNQQFTMRNLVFNNCVTAIKQFFGWTWLYQGVSINSCQTGFDFSNGGSASQAVGSITILDSSIRNTPVGILTAFNPPSSNPPAGGSLIVENVALTNVATAVQLDSGATVLAGTAGSTTIAAWGQGHQYTAAGSKSFQGAFTPTNRPASLVSGGKYYTRSKPSYSTLPISSFASVRSAGAAGNGATDDTTALQNIINSATAAGKIVFFDAGIYLVTRTLLIPPGAKMVGEGLASIILSSGAFFNDMQNPQPVVKVGNTGSSGQVEWSDMILSTKGAQAGAILIEWNLATTGTPSGMWDVHVRVGGFVGSELQVAQCRVDPTNTAIKANCISAYMLMHVTPSASGLYMENNWLWTADHDIDDQSNTQITIYSGRGLLIESSSGTFWLVGTASEHNVLYQYQLANTQNIYMGVIQTETPYYQPNPPAPAPFTVVPALNDPKFDSCAGQAANCYDAWGLRILNSQNVIIYGAGLYSFFINNNGSCPTLTGAATCQVNMVDLEGTLKNIDIYNLATVGVINMISEAGNSLAFSADNNAGFPDILAQFQLASGAGGGTNPTTTATPTTLSTSTTSSTNTATPTNGWQFRGCYTDNVGGRALSMGEPVPGGAAAMTVEACQTVCHGLGYTLAGLEYSQECWCDNALKNGGSSAPDGSAQCNMACRGNSAETCGGPNRLSLYSYGYGNGTTIPTA